ncbi:MAG TPA: hypothetical protein VNL14_03030 [Candidatus Acidoferrales bacterium]|nr:hypothetical protein [Candidatus Acidoferrales bacterium]
MRKLWAPAFHLLVFIVSGALLAYGWLAFEIDRAQRTQRQGDTEAAATIYARAERPFFWIPGLARILAHAYKAVSFGQVAIFYEQNRTDDALGKLEQISATAPALTETGEYAFWTGNLLFRQAQQTKDPEAAVSSAKAALGEFQRGLALEPEDWDLKYNYELVSTMFLKGQSQKKEEQKVKSLLDKMRPTQEPSREDLAPEKRG